MEELVKQLWQAADSKKACRLTMKDEPLPRVVHPYGVCKTSRNKIVLVCRQVAGYTKAGGEEGYRNLILQRIQGVEELEDRFEPSADFNPSDMVYKEWVFHIDPL